MAPDAAPVPRPNVGNRRPTKVEGRWTGPARAPGPVHAVYDVNPTFSMRSSSVAFTVDPVTFGFIR